MTALTNEELLAYLRGELRPSQDRAIAELAEKDREFAARIAGMRTLFGAGASSGALSVDALLAPAADGIDDAQRTSLGLPRGRHKNLTTGLRYFSLGFCLPLVLVGAAYAILFSPAERDFRNFWTPFCPDARVVTVVLPTGTYQLPGIGRKEVVRRLTFDDAAALGAVYQVLLAQPGARLSNIRLATSEDVLKDPTRFRGPMILLGGTSSTRLTLTYWSRLKGLVDPKDENALRTGFILNLRPDAPPAHRNAFARPSLDGRLGIRDLATAELAAVASQEDEHTTHFDPDAAILIRADLDQRPVLFVSGFESYGTWAAMRALAEPGKPASELHRVHRAHGSAEMVIRTKKDSGDTEIFKFRGTNNPRPLDGPTIPAAQ